MKLYIKDYLKNIPIINKFCNIILEYSKEFQNDELNSFNEFNNEQVTDNVTKFLNYVYPSESELKDRLKDDTLTDEKISEIRINNINYLVSLFYSVKGTYKVLDYLTEYDLFQVNRGGNDYSTKINYTTKNINIEIESIPTSFDREIFCELFENFLSDLLYFEELTIIIDKIKTIIVDDTSISLNHGDAYYQYHKSN